MASNAVYSKKEIVTPPGRLGFFNLDKPDSGRQFSDDKYKGDLIFEDPKKIKSLADEALAVAQEMWGEDVELDDLDYPPFKDGNDMFKVDEDGEKIPYAGYAGNVYIRAKSKNRVALVGPKTDSGGDFSPYPAEDFYSGALVRFSVTASACNVGKKRCVTFYLNKVQFLENMDRFGAGARPAKEVFGEWEPEEETTDVQEVTKPKAKKQSSLTAGL